MLWFHSAFAGMPKPAVFGNTSQDGFGSQVVWFCSISLPACLKDVAALGGIVGSTRAAEGAGELWG